MRRPTFAFRSIWPVRTCSPSWGPLLTGSARSVQSVLVSDQRAGGAGWLSDGEATGQKRLEVITSKLPAAVVVGVRGEVDAFTSGQLAAAVDAGLNEDTPMVVIDLNEVRLFGSSGLAVLVAAETVARGTGRLLRVVVDDRRPVIHPMMVTGLTGYLTLFHDLDDALAAGPDAPGDPIGADPPVAPDRR
jgi:anti-sigma B factor antagonist